jgi:hypothetical protein
MKTIWVFYKKDFILHKDEQRGCWEKISHEEAQDLLYRLGCHKASATIKRMIRWPSNHIVIGSTILKIEEYPQYFQEVNDE